MRRYFLIALFTIFSICAQCAVTRYMYVQYSTRTGWSQPYLREVDFFSAQELNTATGRIAFGISGYYVVIWFDKNECAVIKLDVLTAIDRELTDRTLWNIFLINSSIRGMQVNSPNDLEWKITAKYLGQFIDNRITY